MDESNVGVWLERPYVRLGFMIVVFLMLIFIAGKAGFGLWLVSKLNLKQERLEGPPDSAAQALSAYDMIRTMPR
jgi:cytochrome oxidase assembly protein ShyY1